MKRILYDKTLKDETSKSQIRLLSSKLKNAVLITSIVSALPLTNAKCASTSTSTKSKVAMVVCSLGMGSGMAAGGVGGYYLSSKYLTKDLNDPAAVLSIALGAVGGGAAGLLFCIPATKIKKEKQPEKIDNKIIANETTETTPEKIDVEQWLKEKYEKSIKEGGGWEELPYEELLFSTGIAGFEPVFGTSGEVYYNTGNYHSSEAAKYNIEAQHDGFIFLVGWSDEADKIANLYALIYIGKDGEKTVLIAKEDKKKNNGIESSWIVKLDKLAEAYKESTGKELEYAFAVPDQGVDKKIGKYARFFIIPVETFEDVKDGKGIKKDTPIIRITYVVNENAVYSNDDEPLYLSFDNDSIIKELGVEHKKKEKKCTKKDKEEVWKKVELKIKENDVISTVALRIIDSEDFIKIAVESLKSETPITTDEEGPLTVVPLIPPAIKSKEIIYKEMKKKLKEMIEKWYIIKALNSFILAAKDITEFYAYEDKTRLRIALGSSALTIVSKQEDAIKKILIYGSALRALVKGYAEKNNTNMMEAKEELFKNRIFFELFSSSIETDDYNKELEMLLRERVGLPMDKNTIDKDVANEFGWIVNNVLSYCPTPSIIKNAAVKLAEENRYIRSAVKDVVKEHAEKIAKIILHMKAGGMLKEVADKEIEKMKPFLETFIGKSATEILLKQFNSEGFTSEEMKSKQIDFIIERGIEKQWGLGTQNKIK
ncbi:MAG: hypothetical protein QXT45_06570 [Candidatus Bilamarchaeaceae archaeon]